MIYEKIIQQITANINTHGLISNGDNIVIAFSGGPDSVALLNLLCALKEQTQYNFNLIAAHLNHCLRGETADNEELFCRKTTAQYGIQCVSRKINVGQARRSNESVEQAARRVRYEFLKDVAVRSKAGKIAAAHHADDISETLFLRMMRGCGLFGLAALQPIRPLQPSSDIMLIRPLLTLQKKDLLHYLHSIDAPYCTDQSNFETHYQRNYLRIDVIPELKKQFNGNLTDIMSEINKLACQLRLATEAETDELQIEILNEKKEGVMLDARRLKKLKKHLRISLYRRAIQFLVNLEGCAPELTREHWSRLDSLLFEQPGGELTMPGKITARREHGRIYFFKSEMKKQWKRKGKTIHDLPVPGKTGKIGKYCSISAVLLDSTPEDISKAISNTDDNNLKVRLNADQISEPLMVRFRHAGDVLHPLGAPGHKKLKDYFIDRKIPCSLRDNIPLVIDSKGRIVWVVGMQIADFCKLNGGEQKILVLTAH